MVLHLEYVPAAAFSTDAHEITFPVPSLELFADRTSIPIQYDVHREEADLFSCQESSDRVVIDFVAVVSAEMLFEVV